MSIGELGAVTFSVPINEHNNTPWAQALMLQLYTMTCSTTLALSQARMHENIGPFFSQALIASSPLLQLLPNLLVHRHPSVCFGLALRSRRHSLQRDPLLPKWGPPVPAPPGPEPGHGLGVLNRKGLRLEGKGRRTELPVEPRMFNTTSLGPGSPPHGRPSPCFNISFPGR